MATLSHVHARALSRAAHGPAHSAYPEHPRTCTHTCAGTVVPPASSVFVAQDVAAFRRSDKAYAPRAPFVVGPLASAVLPHIASSPGVELEDGGGRRVAQLQQG